MERQTKILLGLGAIIAAYLILKPKKAAARTGVVTSSGIQETQLILVDHDPGWNEDLSKIFENVKNNGGYDGSGINPYGMYSRTPDYIMTPQEMEACNKDPRNCKM
jgi:hypothetical protein